MFVASVFIVVALFVYGFFEMVNREISRDFRRRHAPPEGILQIRYHFRVREQEFGMVCEYRGDRWRTAGYVELDSAHHVMDVLRCDDPAIRRRGDG